jgi:hypothetical protein
MMSRNILSVVLSFYAECHCATCRYADCRYAECRGASFVAVDEK